MKRAVAVLLTTVALCFGGLASFSPAEAATGHVAASSSACTKAKTALKKAETSLKKAKKTHKKSKVTKAKKKVTAAKKKATKACKTKKKTTSEHGCREGMEWISPTPGRSGYCVYPPGPS